MTEFDYNERTIQLIDKIKEERTEKPFFEGRRVPTKAEQELFENIIEHICYTYQNEEFQDEVIELGEFLEEQGYDSYFSWLECGFDYMDLEFQRYNYHDSTRFLAQVDLTHGNSAPYTVFEYNGDILKLIELIDNNFPILGAILF